MNGKRIVGLLSLVVVAAVAACSDSDGSGSGGSGSSNEYVICQVDYADMGTDGCYQTATFLGCSDGKTYQYKCSEDCSEGSCSSHCGCFIDGATVPGTYGTSCYGDATSVVDLGIINEVCEWKLAITD